MRSGPAPTCDMDQYLLRAAIERRTGELVATLVAAGDEGLLAPSSLPGWSRLTVACHLRYGAQALRRMTDAALAGEPASYYPGGRAAERPGTLEPDPGESPADVVASLAFHAAELDRRWSTLDGEQWRLAVSEPADNADLGPLRLGDLAVLRLTEVEVHGTDLGLGLPDWSNTLVATAIPFRLRRLEQRAFPAGIEASWLLAATDGPAHVVAVGGGRVRTGPAAGASAGCLVEGTTRELLALLLGRPRWPAPTGAAASFARAFPCP